MKKALVSTIEPRETGFRIAQVEKEEDTFDVAEGLYWVPCADNIVADQYFYDLVTNSILPIPDMNQQSQPLSSGVQTL